jgi:hypothetical protein
MIMKMFTVEHESRISILFWDRVNDRVNDR